jgi:hypothetical protein
MKAMKISLDPALRERVDKDLAQVNKSYLSETSIMAIAATYNETNGERIYVLGYSPTHKAPSYGLIDIGFMTIAFFMEEKEMQIFDNSTLSWKEGYIEINKAEQEI